MDARCLQHEVNFGTSPRTFAEVLVSVDRILQT